MNKIKIECSEEDIVYISKIAQAELLYTLSEVGILDKKIVKNLFETFYLTGELESDILFLKLQNKCNV